jgi:outer membrane lipoprotein-sorting protein
MDEHEKHDKPDDAIVDRAASALRDHATPPGPSDELLATTLAAIRSADAAADRHPDAHQTSIGRSLLTMKFVTKFAVAAVLALFVGALVWTGGPWGGQAAFADVLQKVQRVQSVRFKSVATVNLPNAPAGTPRTIAMTMLMTSDRMRQDVPGMFSNIYDFKTGQSLAIIAAQKKAIRMKMENLPASIREQNVIEQFRAMRPEQGKSVGRKDVNGRPADVFDVVDAGQHMTIWADRETRLPVRMEVRVNIPSIPQSDVVMTDFRWDVPVDPSELSLEIPAGYEVHEMSFDASTPVEKDLVESLRALATFNGGAFPATFNMAFPAKPLDKAQRNERSREVVSAMRGIMFVTNANGSDFHYAGKGARLNDPNRPIFWYRPAKSETYHVVHADLTVKTDVPAADLPKIESQQVQPAPQFGKPPEATTKTIPPAN